MYHNSKQTFKVLHKIANMLNFRVCFKRSLTLLRRNYRLVQIVIGNWFCNVFSFFLSFLVSVIYSKAKLASACGGIIYFLSYVPYMYVAIREEVAHDKITAFEKCIAVRPLDCSSCVAVVLVLLTQCLCSLLVPVSHVHHSLRSWLQVFCPV